MAHRDVSLPRIALVAIGGTGHAAELVGRGGPTRMTHGGHKPARLGAWLGERPDLVPLFQALPGASFIVNGALPVKEAAGR